MPPAQAEENTQTRPRYLPKTVYFILATNFLSEFVLTGVESGISTFLVLDFVFSNDVVIQLEKYYYFQSFLPLAFAILANLWFGIVKVSLVLLTLSAVGTALLLLSGLVGTWFIALLGIFLSFSSTYATNVCLICLGVEQFQAENAGYQKIYKYFCIVFLLKFLAGFLGALLLPMIPKKFSCSGSYFCYPALHGVALAITMASLGIFYLGYRNYVRIKPEAKKVVQMWRCTTHALRTWRNALDENNSHFLDYAQDQYDSIVITETKRLFGVLLLFLPAALYYIFVSQKSAIWVHRNFRDEYDYLLFIHAIAEVCFLIGLLILPEISWLTSPWKKMGVGGVLVGISFGVAGYLQLYLEGTDSLVSIWIQIPQTLLFALGNLLFRIGGACLIFNQGSQRLAAILYAICLLLPVYPGNFLFWTGWNYEKEIYLIFIYATLIWGAMALLAWLALRFPFPKFSERTEISSMELANMDQNTNRAEYCIR